MFSVRAVSRLAATARPTVRKMSGDPMEAGLEMAKWTKISYGAIAFCGALTTCARPRPRNYLPPAVSAAPAPPTEFRPSGPPPPRFFRPPRSILRRADVGIVEYQHLMHPHDSDTPPMSCAFRVLLSFFPRDSPTPLPRARRHLKIRTKPYPWGCPDCNFFDSACWKQCKAAERAN